jgi:hypothetical protein
VKERKAATRWTLMLCTTMFMRGEGLTLRKAPVQSDLTAPTLLLTRVTGMRTVIGLTRLIGIVARLIGAKKEVTDVRRVRSVM